MPKLAELLEIPTAELLQEANALREKYQGNSVSLCSIINARSGKCSEDCCYCAQSAYHQTDSPEYKLLPDEEIISAAQKAKNNGACCFSIVTSGKKPGSKSDFNRILQLVGKLRSSGINISASLGILSQSEAEELAKAGLYKYHHNLETSRSFFNQVCTTHSYEDRVQTIEYAKNAGLKVCCGGIFGLGESWEQRIELAEAIKELDVDSIPLNFLHPIKGTKIYGKVPPLTIEEILRTIAIFRIINPTKIIGVMGGRQIHLKDRQAEIFQAGANAILIGNYLTTKGSELADDLLMIEKLGLEPIIC